MSVMKRLNASLPVLEIKQKIKQKQTVTGLTLHSRCRLLPATTDSRRGSVAFVGPVPGIPGTAGPWIGVVLDEPTGKNDGSVKGTRYFSCAQNCGVFVRPERVEVGDFPPLNLEEDMEEL